MRGGMSGMDGEGKLVRHLLCERYVAPLALNVHDKMAFMDLDVFLWHIQFT